MGYLFLYIQNVLYALLLMICQSVQHMNYCRRYTVICTIQWNLFLWIILSPRCLYTVFVARNAMFRLVVVNRLCTECTSELYNVVMYSVVVLLWWWCIVWCDSVVVYSVVVLLWWWWCILWWYFCGGV